MKGVYILLIQLSDDVDVKIGALGTRHFAKGLYAYVGSAQTNFQKRINRHLRKEKLKFWHIDYLLDNNGAKILKVLFKDAAKTEECKIAKEISRQHEAAVGFGCSDCRCKSHLFKIKNKQSFSDSLAKIKMSEFNS